MRYQKVIRHGNALGVVIPAAVCRELKVHRGDVVKLLVGQKVLGGDDESFLYLEIWPVVDAHSTSTVKRYA